MKLSKNFKKVLSAMLAIALLVGMSNLPLSVVQAEEATPVPISSEISNGDIVILYSNDSHCAVDGFEKVSAVKKEMQEKTDYVSLVSSGDFVQGATIGALSKGESVIDIMNEVGYDVVTIGNHEFDYEMPQLFTLMDKLQAKVVSCNFMEKERNKPVYASYTMKKYGDKKVAFIGITTPESITKSTPAYFQDEDGNYVYDFCNDKTGKALYKRVQKTVDVARKKGADYVVALAHLGTDGTTEKWTSTSVINNTTGIDILLDGHSHSTYASEMIKNKQNKDVMVSSTGSKFANLGELVITKDGDVSAKLVSLKEYEKKDEAVTNYVAELKKAYEAEVSKVIGKTTVDLTTLNPETKKRAIRNSETNLGDFCADALRTVLDADVAIMNGGGIRADIEAGDITYNHLLTVFPWSNMGCVMEATGQEIKNALEHGARNYPDENGGFLQVSGMTYEINTSIKSSVKVDDAGMFKSINGKYRVQNIKVLNKKTGKYEKLDLKKKYTLAGINYTLKSSGDGYTMFKDNKVLKDEVAVDNEILITYLTKNLNGVVGKEYKNPNGQGRIKIVK